MSPARQRILAGVGYLLKQRPADVERFAADVRRVAGGATAPSIG